MPAVTSLASPVRARAADLPEEFGEPVSYYDRWLWLALLALFVVVVYYAVVLVMTRAPSVPSTSQRWRPFRPVDPQAEHLKKIDRIEYQARHEEIDFRKAHQQLSETVRSYVDTVTPLPAETMSLADLKALAPGELAQAIELMYLPAFAPGDVGKPRERFDAALHNARRLVSTWR